MPSEIVLQVLRHLWATLKPLDIPLALVGGIALATWKYIRATKDVDVLMGIGEADLPDVLERLLAANVRFKQDPPVVDVGALAIVQLQYEPPETFVDVQIDLLLARSPYHFQSLDRRVPTRLPGLDVEIDVLACEDLILHKLEVGRLIDRADAAALLRANRHALDVDYLRQWADELKITEELSEVWGEAFPGESP